MDLAGQDIGLDFQPVIARYQDKSLTKSQILTLVKELTEVLYSKGYSTSAIGLKDKNIADGHLKFIVHWGWVKGFLVNGQSANTFKDRAMLSTLPTLTQQPLSVFDIDQIVEITNGVNKSAQVKVIPSDEVAKSYLNVETARNSLPRFSLGFNNSGAGNNANGRNQLTTTVSASDLLGINDSWSFSTGYRLYDKSKQNNQHNYTLNYSQPFGFYTLDLKLSHSDFDKALQGRNGTYSNEGKTQTANLKLSRILVRDRDSMLTAYGELEFKKKKNYVVNRLTNDHLYSKLDLGLSHLTTLWGGKLHSDIHLSQGLHWFGSKPTAYLNNKDRNLQLLAGSVNWHKAFVWSRPLNYQLRIAGQYSKLGLLSDNQFSIGDEYTVRGFKGGVASGERGFYVSQTLSMPFYPQKNYLSTISPFIGLDWGQTHQKALKQHNKLMGLALGFKAQAKNISLSVTYAKPLSNTLKDHSDRGGVVYFNSSVHF
ncbi:hypothetical protein A6A21_02230 [Phocoenobacter uteri]|nr:hypothetical protein [Phocoenobacter uteri]